MADQLLEKARDIFEGQIDFQGQWLAETLATALLGLVGALSFLIGYFTQDIKLALWIGLGGTAVVFLAIIPPWPFYNRDPVQWVLVGGAARPGPQVPIEGLTIDAKPIT